MNEFSIPMPMEKHLIDEILEINKKLSKSKITNLYFGLPINCEDYTGFEQARCFYKESTNLAHWLKLIEYTKNNGLDFIYLLNTPRSIDANDAFLPKKIEKLNSLIMRLKHIGCNKYRISHPKLFSYLSKYYPDLNLYASTSFEYNNIKQYQNFIKMHPEVKQIVPSHDVNKNFLLLKNLRKQYPNLDIEIIVNEGCMGGCPHRAAHSCQLNEINIPNRNIEISKIDEINELFYISICTEEFQQEPFLNICKSNNIYPWEIKEYNKIGINKFKLVGRDYSNIYQYGGYIKDAGLYLKGIEDYDVIKLCWINMFNHHIRYMIKGCTVVDIKPYLPKIAYFKKYGHLCASKCGVSCFYCYKCAEKIKKKLSKKVIIK